VGLLQQPSACGVGALGELLEHELTLVGESQERGAHGLAKFFGDRRPVDGDILLVSDEGDPQLRWRFTDIGPDSFTWQGEASHDGGRTWVFEEQMRATRRRSR